VWSWPLRIANAWLRHPIPFSDKQEIQNPYLLHLFNHQTHHRGQAHACLSLLTGGEPPSLDLLVFQRGGTALDLEALI